MKERPRTEGSGPTSEFFRQTALLDLAAVPEVARQLEGLARALAARARELVSGECDELLGEPLSHARMRAVADELRHLVEVVERSAEEEGQSAWKSEQSRDLRRIALRIEKWLGPRPTRSKVERT